MVLLLPPVVPVQFSGAELLTSLLQRIGHCLYWSGHRYVQVGTTRLTLNTVHVVSTIPSANHGFLPALHSYPMRSFQTHGLPGLGLKLSQHAYYDFSAAPLQMHPFQNMFSLQLALVNGRDGGHHRGRTSCPALVAPASTRSCSWRRKRGLCG